MVSLRAIRRNIARLTLCSMGIHSWRIAWHAVGHHTMYICRWGGCGKAGPPLRRLTLTTEDDHERR